jgi:hypothetical protein
MLDSRPLRLSDRSNFSTAYPHAFNKPVKPCGHFGFGHCERLNPPPLSAILDGGESNPGAQQIEVKGH